MGVSDMCVCMSGDVGGTVGGYSAIAAPQRRRLIKFCFCVKLFQRLSRGYMLTSDYSGRGGGFDVCLHASSVSKFMTPHKGT